MEGVERYQVRLLPHQEAWEREFLAVRRLLWETLGSVALDIQHVGSTAMRGLEAKPILDVAVLVRSFGEMNAAGLTARGYEDCGESGVSGRRLFVLRDGTLSLRHIHCYEPGDPSFGAQVRFRDYLNAHPGEARAYGALKRALAAEYAGDRARYTAGKHAFIQRVLAESAGEGSGKREK